MEIQYKRDMTKSYMCIPAGSELYAFEKACLTKQRVKGIVPVFFSHENGEEICWYDITGKQALDTCAEMTELSYLKIQHFFGDLCATLDQLENYLLNPARILLNPECIFLDHRTGQFWFCYYPGEQQEIINEFQKLVEYMLTKIDHKEKAVTEFIYQMYESVKKEGCSLEQIREQIRFENVKEEEEKVQIESGRKEMPEAVVEIKQSDRKERGKGEKQERQEKNKQMIGKWILNYLRKNFFKDYKKLKSWKKDREKQEYIEPIAVEPEEETIKRGRPTVLLSEQRTEPLGILKYEGYHHLPDLLVDQIPYVIGSAGECNGRIELDTISRKHARITKVDTVYFMEDLNSANGTKVGGTLLDYKGKISLERNEIIEFADEKFRFI